jgi:hypothetical protein
MNGTWSAYSLLLVDKLGNNTSLYKTDLEALFGSGVTNVQNNAATYDSARPEITAFNLSPKTINTDDSNVDVTLTMTLIDQYAGVCIPGDCDDYTSSATQLRMKAPSGTQMIYFTDFIRTAGSDLNGTYTSTATFPKGSRGGIWTADYLFINDKIGNNEFLSAVDIEALFGNDASDIVNNASSFDENEPEITAFEITPTEINTDESSQTLTLNVTLKDDISGICIRGDCGDYNSSETQLRLSPLIGTQYIDFTSLTRVSGNELDGVYEATATVPKSSKEGIWQVEYLLLVDKIGNNKFLSADDLNALFPNAEGLTITNTAEASSVTIDREWTLSSENTSVTFPAGTIVTREDGGNFAFYRIVNEEFSIEEVTDEGMDGVPIFAIRFGIPGLNLSFSENVTVAFKVGSEYEGEILQIQSLGEEAGSWANETECTVDDGQCNFTVDHATYLIATYNPSGGSSSGGVYDERHNTLVDLNPKILAISGPGEKTRLWAYDRYGNETDVKIESGLFPDSYTGGAGVVSIDQNNNYVRDQFLFFAQGSEGSPQARIMGLRSDGSAVLKGQMYIFQAPGDKVGTSSIKSGLSMVVDDFDGDGFQDDAAACLTGNYKPHIKVFKDATGIDNWELINQFDAPFGAVGCNLGTFQYDTDASEILVTPNHGPASPYVYIYTVGGTLKKQFKAYNDPINQGLTASSVEGRIYTTPNNGSSHVRAFDKDGNPKNFWWVYQKHVRGDFTIRAGDIDLDSKDELITSPVGANGSHVLAFEPTNKWRTWPNFFAFNDETLRNGVGIAVIENWHGVN